jgi:hypothetical protein
MSWISEVSQRSSRSKGDGPVAIEPEDQLQAAHFTKLRLIGQTISFPPNPVQTFD